MTTRTNAAAVIRLSAAAVRAPVVTLASCRCWARPRVGFSDRARSGVRGWPPPAAHPKERRMTQPVTASVYDARGARISRCLRSVRFVAAHNQQPL